MLNEIVQRMEREQAGLIDPTDEQRKRPLKEHVAEFEKYLRDKGVTLKQVKEVSSQLGKIVAGCKWKRISDINVGSLLGFLGDMRRQGKSAQTYNHYLKAAKSFTNWLVRDKRTPTNPLAFVQRLNVKQDRRHDRRPLSDDEFALLIAAAEQGKPVEGVSGPDRAMLYKLAAWTGFRRTELGSLTPRSLDLDGTPPTATVAACYAKGGRQDAQPLHVELARQVKTWLRSKDISPTSLIFPISAKVPGGIDRKTHKMIKRDLEIARTKWIKDGKSKKERDRREKSDFLCYVNHEGLYADFHACRHRFITALERSGISPKMAQTLARHSDIRLTLGVYTHVDEGEKVKAIGALPAPPKSEDGKLPA